MLLENEAYTRQRDIRVPWFRPRPEDGDVAQEMHRTGGGSLVELPQPVRLRHQREIRDFQLPEKVEDQLRPEDYAVLEPLVRAGIGVADLYAYQDTQLDSSDPALPFYPAGAKKAEIERAAAVDPQVLSAYTQVIRQPDGNLLAVPQHVYHKGAIARTGIIKNLHRAADAAGKRGFRDPKSVEYFNAIARGFKQGDWEGIIQTWLARDRHDTPKIDVVLGPYDRYSDKLLQRKFAWEGWINIVDQEASKDAQAVVDAFQKWRSQETGNTPLVIVRMGHTRIQVGQAARYNWTANNLPCQPEWRSQYGAVISGFEEAFDDKMPERLVVLGQAIHPATIRRIGLEVPSDQYSEVYDLVKTSYARRLLTHEASHSQVPSGFEQRLGSRAQALNETYCDVLGLEGYGNLTNTARNFSLDPRERELALATAFSEGLIEYRHVMDQRSSGKEAARSEYLDAALLPLNYCIQQGSVQVEDGKLTWHDENEVYGDISRFRHMLEDGLQSGGQRWPSNLYKRFYNESVYEELTHETRPRSRKLGDIFSRGRVNALRFQQLG